MPTLSGIGVTLGRDGELTAPIVVLAEPVEVVKGWVGEEVGVMDEVKGIGVFLADGGCLELAWKRDE